MEENGTNDGQVDVRCLLKRTERPVLNSTVGLALNTSHIW